MSLTNTCKAESLDNRRPDRGLQGVRQYGRAELRAVREENNELRRAAGGDIRWTLEEWEAVLPQHIRDAFAARALIASEGDGFRAVVRLGFAKLRVNQAREIVQRVFLTPGVQAILARDLSEPEQHRQELVERQVRIALYGDDTNAVRAFQMLAKTCGWVQGPEIMVQHNKQTIFALVTEKNARGEIEAETVVPSFLEHEPGAATRIDSGEHIAAALGSAE